MTALVIGHGQPQDGLDRLLRVTSPVLNEHANHAGPRAARGTAFPVTMPCWPSAA